jgi:hypothetical protein
MRFCPAAQDQEWVDVSHGKVRADVAHDKLVALGYTGSSAPPAGASVADSRSFA